MLSETSLLHKQLTAREGLMDVASSGSHVRRAGESMGNQFLEFDIVLQYVIFHPGQNILTGIRNSYALTYSSEKVHHSNWYVLRIYLFQIRFFAFIRA
jgi:hypothetical protein